MAGAGCEHLLQPYTDEQFLASAVAGYLAAGLRRGQGAVIIATPARSRAFASALSERADLGPEQLDGKRILWLDAEQTLARFMTAGGPDRTAFRSVIEPALARIRAAGYSRLRLYGEMVDLLWPRDVAAALALEALWNEAPADGSLSLLCAYRMDPLERPTQKLLRPVTECHSRLLPARDQEGLDRAVDRAYAEIFGASRDAEELRELLVAGQDDLPPMPRAHAMMMALADLSSRIAAEVAVRARAHYGLVAS